MPNWTFLILHFVHTTALGLWVGGIVAIGVLAAPTTFKLLPNRRQAGTLMGAILRRFDRLVVGCIVALVVTSVLFILWYGRMSRWYAIEYVCIGMMSTSAIYSMLVLAPRIRRLREEHNGDHPDFPQLHRLAVLIMQFNLACGTVALFFS